MCVPKVSGTPGRAIFGISIFLVKMQNIFNLIA